jgi:putative membrane protein
MMRWFKWLGWPAGVALLLGFAWREGVGDVLPVLGHAGPALLWLVPFHALPLLLDAQAWRLLLGGRAPLVFLWWIATVREAVGRLLPVVGVGGEIVGIRLARWRVDDAHEVTASVMVEVLITIAVQYVYTALGLLFLLGAWRGADLGTFALGFVLSLPLPFVLFVLLRRGGIFHAIERFASRILGESSTLLQDLDGRRLDAAIDALMSRPGLLLRAFAWQLSGYMLGSLENYWALQLLGHPVSAGGAFAIEAVTQAVRHAAFMVPGGLGVQEAAVTLVARTLGVASGVGLSLALVKRAREVLFGLLALASWQLAELWRVRRATAPSGRA